jgi:serine/threonine protein kinase
MIRVHELAKELKISTMSLKTHLTALGVITKSHMSFVEDDIANQIREYIKKTKDKVYSKTMSSITSPENKLAKSYSPKPKARVFDIGKLDHSYLVFCDTCSFMHSMASYLIVDGLTPILKSNQLHLIVAKRVIDELQKHQNNKLDQETSKSAYRGLKIIKTLQNMQICDIYGDNNDPFADNLFISMFSKFRQSHNLLMITQDNSLAGDLLALSDQKSVYSNKSLYVCFIGDSGDLVPQSTHEQRELKKRKTIVPQRNEQSRNVKYSVTSSLKANYTLKPCKTIPIVTDIVFTDTKEQFVLKSKISEGGEGCTYLTENGYVCKIYRKDKVTDDRYQKLVLMSSNPLSYPGICWPQKIVYNRHNEFVGYIMPLAKGKLLQRCVFLPMLLKSEFPNWTRLNLVKLAICIAKKIDFLHKHNVIIGDINPLNIMVNADEDVYFIDTDSYQIDGYPCPVGTVNFTAPEIQGKDFKAFLRTIEHEKFAVATLLFMILLPGKPPYSQLGGENPMLNIKKQDFSYPLKESSNKKTPLGSWRYIWSHLPLKMKEAFYNTFKKNERITVLEWIKLLEWYRYNIEEGINTNELFPTKLKIVIEVVCSTCGDKIFDSQEHINRTRSSYNRYICEKCKRITNETHDDSKSMNPQTTENNHHIDIPVRLSSNKSTLPCITIDIKSLAIELGTNPSDIVCYLFNNGFTTCTESSYIYNVIADRVRNEFQNLHKTNIPKSNLLKDNLNNAPSVNTNKQQEDGSLTSIMKWLKSILQ